MDLVIFGANGPTGRLAVRAALTAGHHVRAVTRRPDQFPVSSPDLEVVVADVTDPDGVDRAVAGTEAVISTFGVPYGLREITVYSHGITNIIRAMDRHGVDRLACVTSTTVAGDAPPGESLLWRVAMIPLLRRVVGRSLYDDMERMEAIVRASDLDWTVLRPGGLFDATDPSEDYEVSERRLTGRVTSRADLADALVREVTAPRHSRATVDVITRSGLPSFTTFLADAFHG